MQLPLTVNSSASGSNDESSSSSRVLCFSSNSSILAHDHLPTVTESPAEAIERIEEPMIALVGDQLLDDYQVTDLPDDGSTTQACSVDQPLVTTAQVARIEFLECEYSRSQNCERKDQHFVIDQIKHDDHLVSFYTGFPSIAIFLAFFSSLNQLWVSYNTGVANKMLRKVNVQRNLFLWTNCL